MNIVISVNVFGSKHYLLLGTTLIHNYFKVILLSYITDLQSISSILQNIQY